MTITGGSAMSKEDIDRMIKEAEQYADEDRQRREAAESRNQADSLVYSTEKFLSENGDKIPADIKSKVETDVASLKTALEGDDTEAIKAAMTTLANSSQSMGSAMYANADAGAADASSASDAGGSSSDDESIVDAEIVDEGTPDDGDTGTGTESSEDGKQ
jgi:molecular chaperone DnaK